MCHVPAQTCAFKYYNNKIAFADYTVYRLRIRNCTAERMEYGDVQLKYYTLFKLAKVVAFLSLCQK